MPTHVLRVYTCGMAAQAHVAETEDEKRARLEAERQYIAQTALQSYTVNMLVMGAKRAKALADATSETWTPGDAESMQRGLEAMGIANVVRTTVATMKESFPPRAPQMRDLPRGVTWRVLPPPPNPDGEAKAPPGEGPADLGDDPLADFDGLDGSFPPPPDTGGGEVDDLDASPGYVLETTPGSALYEATASAAQPPPAPDPVNPPPPAAVGGVVAALRKRVAAPARAAVSDEDAELARLIEEERAAREAVERMEVDDDDV